MPTTNYDSSEQTRRVRDRALYLYNLRLQQARALNPNIVASEQTQFQVLEVVVERRLGGCMCVDSYRRRDVPGLCMGCGSN